MKTEIEFATGFVLSDSGEWLESLSPEIWSDNISDACTIPRSAWNTFESKLLDGGMYFISEESLTGVIKLPLASESKADSDLRSFGLIHDAIVSIYGADSLEVGILRVIREAGVKPVDIRAGLSEALGRLMQGL